MIKTETPKKTHTIKTGNLLKSIVLSLCSVIATPNEAITRHT